MLADGNRPFTNIQHLTSGICLLIAQSGDDIEQDTHTSAARLRVCLP